MTTKTLPRLHVGVGWQSDGLTLFPVWAEMPVNETVVVNSTDVQVTEMVDGPTVGKLVLTNSGDRPALLLEGELLEGGWQNRALNTDLLLAPHGSQAADVTCVEQGRWSGDDRLARRNRLAPGMIRVGLRRNDSYRQQDVWRRVSHYEPTMGPTSTLSLSDQLDKVSVGRDGLNRAVGRVRPSTIPAVPLPGQVGVIGALSGRPAWLEIFSSPAALADFWSSIVDAGELDAHASDNTACPAQAARDFVVHCGQVSLHAGQVAGVGTQINGSHRSLSVRGITSDEGDLLHVLAVETDHPNWAGV